MQIVKEDQTKETQQTITKAPETIATVTVRKEFDTSTGKVKAITRRKRIVSIGPIQTAVIEKQAGTQTSSLALKTQTKKISTVAWSTWLMTASIALLVTGLVFKFGKRFLPRL